MITSIKFRNFKVLRDATLPLGLFTLIVGPNGSGKSTAMQGLTFVRRGGKYDFDRIQSAGLDATEPVRVTITWAQGGEELSVGAELAHSHDRQVTSPTRTPRIQAVNNELLDDSLDHALSRFRIYSFDAEKIATAAQINIAPELRADGFGLSSVLDDLSSQEPDRFDALTKELHRWLPEFDRILFETPTNGMKVFQLRTAVGHHKYSASDLSQGTLFAVALLTLAYLKDPPAIVCFEEPDRGIHPRLLSEIRDGMYRLAYPESFGESREAVQVIATTHSPYLLNLYKDHPEEIVIAHKDDQGGHFDRLSDKSYITEILEAGDAPLGEIWFSGILGGVPSSP